MQASGMVQVGAVSRGYLEPAQSVSIPLQASTGCVTLVALGGPGVGDIAIAVLDADGKELATDDTVGPDASLRYCPTQSTKQSLRVAMAKGSSGFSVAVWSGGSSDNPAGSSDGASSVQSGGGSCDAPMAMVAGQTYVGNTEDGRSMEGASCAPGNGRELVYRLDVPARSRVTIEVKAVFDSVLHVRRGDCTDSDAEVACNDDTTGWASSRIDEVFDEGTYYVFVDGYGERDEGTFQMRFHLRPAPTSQNPCQRMPSLLAGNVTRGRLADDAPRASLACGSLAGRHTWFDQPYRLDVASRSHVRVDATGQGFPPIVRVRTACDCAERDMPGLIRGGQGSYAAVLDAGSYVVFVGSDRAGASGDYSVSTRVRDIASMDAAADTPGDACGDAIPLPGEGWTVAGDTFGARHDIKTSCGGNESPDVLYRVDLVRDVSFTAFFHRDEGDHCLALFSSCGTGDSEITCGASGVSADLRPGTHWLAVKSRSNDRFGRYEVGYQMLDLEELNRAWASATPLVWNRPLSATTTGAMQVLRLDCESRPLRRTGGDRFHRFTVSQAKDVFITAVLPDGASAAVVKLVRGTKEMIACQQGAGGSRPLGLRRILEPGTYGVVVGAIGFGTDGNYTLTVSERPLQ